MAEALLQFGGLGLAALVIILWFKWITNHQKHNNDIIAGNAAAMEGLSKSIEDNTKATNRLGDILLKKG